MKTAEDTYLLYARKSEEARIGDALDERGILNVTVAAPPVVPALPKRSGWFVGLAAFAAATTASTALCFIADHLDPVLRTPAEVIASLGAPVLASLPREAA
jgi:capsular polysaccharide biosynthesis protein